MGVKRCFFAVLMLIAFSAVLWAQDGWNKVTDKDGIQVFTRPVEGSSLDEFRGITVVDVRPEIVLALIDDVPAQTQWMADCIESKVVKRYSDEDQVVYNVTNAPWPVSNRDVLVRSKVSYDDQGTRVEIKFNAVEDESVPPRDGHVRMTSLEGSWLLERVDGNKTRVQYTIKADPAGRIPANLANRTSRGIPFETLTNMKKMVKKEKYIKGAAKFDDYPR